MSLIKERRILEEIEKNTNLQIISIKTTSDNFNRRFESISHFWKSFSNSLNSVEKKTNRQVMKGINGMYCSLELSDDFQIIIVYDGSKQLNNLDTSIRLKKLLGLSIQIEYGTYDDFKPIIYKMFGIRRKIQPFGQYYSKYNTIS
jgi:hypothetical protein